MDVEYAASCAQKPQQRLPLTLNPRYLYRGLASSVVNMGALSSVSLTAVKNVIVGNNSKRVLTDTEKIVASFADGGTWVSLRAVEL